MASAETLSARWPLVGRAEEQRRLRAALTDGRTRSAAIVGPPGVGKTRLAEEVLALADERGMAICRLAATPTGREIPCGVFFGLLTVAEPAADLDLVQYIVDQVDRLAAGRRLLVFLDDAHDVDPVSALVIAQIALQAQGFVLVTRRDEIAEVDALRSLWKEDAAVRVDLAALSPGETERLTAAALGGHVEGASARTLWGITQGNPLYLRELLLGAQEAGLLEVTDGVWRLLGFPHSPRLAELVEARLEGLTPEQRSLLEHLALAEPLPLELADALVDRRVVEDLEGLGLLSVVDTQDHRELYVAHPVHGEVLRGGLAPLRVLAINRRLADAAGAVPGIDPLRSAVWRLDGGGEVEPHRMTAAARHAHFAQDTALTARLARAAWEAGAGVEAGLLLAAALVAGGRPGEAEPVLVEAADLATTDAERALVAMSLAETLVWGLGRGDEADAVLAGAVAALGDGSWLDEVLGMRAVNLLLAGRPREAAAAGMPLLSRSRGRARVEAATVVSPALAMAGRTAEAIAVARQGYDDCVALGDQLALAGPGLHLVARSVAELEAGLVPDAATTARQLYDDGIEQQSTSTQAWGALTLSRVALLAGPLVDAERYGAEGALLFRQLGQLGQVRWCLACRAWALASSGRLAPAAAVVAELEEIEGGLPMMEVDVDRARAWALAADPERAVPALIDAGEAGLSTGTLALAAGAFHDVVRLGRPELAVDRLADLADDVDGQLMAARLAHARALVSGAADAVAEAASGFERIGAITLAAEAAAQASSLWARLARARDARGAAQRARALARAAGRLATPAMLLAGPAAALTRREREIAGLAAAGRTNRDIAGHLALSVRTVENHLQHAFEKLGASGREDLAELLGLLGPE